MYLPNADEAHVAESKISGYLLAADHPSGRGKALFFRALGFEPDHPVDLRNALVQHAAIHAVSSVAQTSFGAKYLIDGYIVGRRALRRRFEASGLLEMTSAFRG